jgi:3-isopropylmalate/(R)-2-methylmalate dehydratase small subunit
MHVLEPARLKPGVTVDQLPDPGPAMSPTSAPSRIRGRALIFWDPAAPPGTKKRDAIDTDQITPAADCVSESLETLDEKWKAGSFRHLMPNFRARVHAGETFLIAGDRFAIGSSREMSPAGLKGVAEEVGREMVIICGQNMGDIFRRNSFNLGLHVVQCPEAVADARDGDEFEFDPASRGITNLTPEQVVYAGPALRQGRGDPAQRRHLRGRPARVQVIGHHQTRGRVSRSRLG